MLLIAIVAGDGSALTRVQPSETPYAGGPQNPEQTAAETDVAADPSHRRILGNRIKTVAIAIAAAVACLAIAYAYLKLELVTRGFYSGRLQVVALVGMAAVLGIAYCVWTTLPSS